MSAIPTSTNIYYTSNNSTQDIITDFSAYSTIQPTDELTATNILVSQIDLNQIFEQAVPIGTSISGILTNINATIQDNVYDLGRLFGPTTQFNSGILPFTAIGDYSYIYDYTARTYYITFNTIGGIQFNTNLTNVNMIVVGGGGAGGACDITATGSCGAGGGGGGAISVSTAVTNNPLTGLVANNMYYINVGRGGNGIATSAGTNGGSSFFVDMSGTALITSTGGRGGLKTNTNSGGGLGGSSTYTSIFTPSYSNVTTGYGGMGGSNSNQTSSLGSFGTQSSLSYQNYLNNFILKSSTNLKNSLSLYNYFLFSGGGGGASESVSNPGYSGGGGFGIYKGASGGTYGYATSMTYPIANSNTNYYVNQMPSSFIGSSSGLCPGAGGAGVGSKMFTINGNTIGGNGIAGTVKLSFGYQFPPFSYNIFTITGKSKQYLLSLANGSTYFLVYCYPGTSTLTFVNNNYAYGSSILGIGGGGGGGGGGYFTADNLSNKPGLFISGAGGGGGGTCVINNTTLFGTYNITVGKGGTGGFGGSINTSAINGSTGGNTSVVNGTVNVFTCTGGIGGNSYLDVNGGAAGSVSCNYSYTGGQGGQGGQGGKNNFVETIFELKYNNINTNSFATYGFSTDFAVSDTNWIYASFNYGYTANIAYSSNYGATWNYMVGNGTGYWNQCCCSDNGQYAFFTESSGLRYVNNFGTSTILQANIPGNSGMAVTCSSNGQYVYYCNYSGSPSTFYYSTNYGSSWTTISFTITVNSFSWLTCSSSGQYVYIINTPVSPKISTIFISNNYGISFSQLTNPASSPNNNIASIVCNETGDIVYICCGSYTQQTSSGQIYISQNYGLSWTSIYPGNNNWTSIACNRMGNLVVASQYNGNIFISRNYGATWDSIINSINYWSAINLNPNGTILMAGISNGDFPNWFTYNLVVSGNYTITSSPTIPLSGTSSSLISYLLPDETIIYCGGGGGGGSARYSNTQYVGGVPIAPLNYNGGAAGYGYGGLVGSSINAADSSLNILDSSSNGANGIFWGSGGGGGASNASVTNKTYGGSGGDGAVLFIIPADSSTQINVLQKNIYNTENELTAAQKALQNFKPSYSGYNNWFENNSLNSNTDSWVGIAIANNGYIFLASFTTIIYKSSNYAGSFTTQSVGTGHREIAISANGQYGIVCNPGPYYIYTTNNFGNTWVQTGNYGRWQTIAGSSTCQYSILGTNGEGLNYSNDYGNTYNLSNITDGFSQVAISSSGQYCLAAYRSGPPFNIASTGKMYYSINYGQTWTVSNTPFANWGKCAIEDNGIGYAVNSTDYIYKTTNYGQTWSPIIGSGASAWSMVRMDSSGQHLLGAKNSAGFIYSSSDYGESWTQTNNPYMSNITNICISRNGQFAGACGYNDYVYFSPFSQGSSSSSQLVENVIVAEIAYNNALYVYNNAAIILSTTSIMPLAPTVNSISNIEYKITNEITNYGLYSLSDTYKSGIQNILTNMINSSINGSIDIYNFLNNTNYYNYLIGYDNTGIATLQSVSALININKNVTSNSLVLNYLPTTGTSYSICSNPTGQYLGLCVYGGYVYNSTNYGNSWSLNTSYSIKNWSSICNYYKMTADGIYMYPSYNICEYGGSIYNTIGIYSWTTRTSAGARQWRDIASSFNGTKLAAASVGHIYTSTDSGVTWTQANGPFNAWYKITSSSDGTKLAASTSTVYGGYIFTSTDSGINWTQRTSVYKYLNGIESSSDGTFIAASAESDYINTSTDSGITWTQQTGSGIRQWSDIAVSSDGTKIAACAYNQPIYTSTNSGVTWTQQTGSGSRYWYCITSSSDGTKLAAGTDDYIYTSTDSGVTWKQRTSVGSQYWFGISSSDNGSIICALCGNATNTATLLTVSRDYGVTWEEQTSIGNQFWNGLKVSSNGLRIAACYARSGYICTSNISTFTVSQSTAPTANWTSICSDISGINFAACIDNSGIYISNDAGASWITTNAPSSGWTSICCDSIGTKFFSCSNGSGIYNSTTNLLSWSQSYSSTSNFTSICCDITGTYIYSCINDGQIYSSSDSGSTWSISSAPNANWSAIKCNSTGSIVAAAINNGYIYISTNSGTTWEQTTSPLSNWTALSLDFSGVYLTGVINPLFTYNFINNDGFLTRIKNYISSITSDPTGQYLGLTVYGGNVYKSTNYGESWVQNNNFLIDNWTTICNYSNGSNYIACTDNYGVYKNGINLNIETFIGELVKPWTGIASSSDGTKLAACAYLGNYIYTSTDSGNTWTQQTNSGSRFWTGIASSSDGSFLVACDYSPGYIYTSTDSGNTWTAQTNSGANSWREVVCSSNGSVIVSYVAYEYVYISTNYGVSWIPQISLSVTNWTGVNISPDGTKIAAIVNRNLYISTNTGSSWNLYTLDMTNVNGQLRGISSSSDFTNLAVCSYNDYIYTSTDSGNTWIQNTNSGSRTWSKIASSSDGTIIAAIVDTNDFIYVSNNSGNTWSQHRSQKNWTDITFSFENIIACATNDSIFTNINTIDLNFKSICCDLTGVNIAVCADGYGIYISSNNGTSWSSSDAPFSKWYSICCDSTGTYFAACVYGSQIYTSNNNGYNWTITNSPIQNWISICSNYTGQYLAACIYDGSIYTSSNYGTSWVQTSAPSSIWSSISCDSTGAIITACINNGSNYISYNYGIIWSVLDSSNLWSFTSISANGYLITTSSDNGSVYNIIKPTVYTLTTPVIETITGNSFIINYTPVIQARSYAIYIHTTNTFTPLTNVFKTIKTNSTTNGTYLITGLPNLTTYCVMIIGYTLPNQKGIAFQSPYTNLFNTVLNTPNNPIISNIASTTVTINYTSVPSANSYAIYLSTSETFTPSTIGLLSNFINSTTSGSITVSELTSGTRYYAIIVAYTEENATGIASYQSNYSSVIVFLDTPVEPYFDYLNVSRIYFTVVVGALSYGIYISTSTSFTPTSQGVISQTQNSLTNGSIDFTSQLTIGITYYAIVVAYDSLNATGRSSLQSGYSPAILRSSVIIQGSNSSIQFKTPVVYNDITYKILYITSGSGRVAIPSTTVALVLVGGGGGGGSNIYGGIGGQVTIINNPPVNIYNITIGSGGNRTSNGANTTCISTSNSYSANGGRGNISALPSESYSGTKIVYNELYYGGGGGTSGTSPSPGNSGGGGGAGGTEAASNTGVSRNGTAGGGLNPDGGYFGGPGGDASTSLEIGFRAGKNGTTNSFGGGGGGGGAGSSNTSGESGNGGNGGNGINSGQTTTGGGGAGGTFSGLSGGGGGGGNGGVNTGGGGGAGGSATTNRRGAGGAGGSGIVLIIYT